jgi:hypothetical protein
VWSIARGELSASAETLDALSRELGTPPDEKPLKKRNAKRK